MELRDFRHRRDVEGSIIYGWHAESGLFIISGADGPEALHHPGVTLHDGTKVLVEDDGRIRPLTDEEAGERAKHPAPRASVPAGAAPPHPEGETSIKGVGALPKPEPQPAHKGSEKAEQSPLGTLKHSEEEASGKKK